MTRVLVIGRQGQIARALIETLPIHGFDVISLARPDIDLLDRESLRTAVAAVRPQVVINPAAYTAVDRAEDEPDAAMAVNRDGADAVARASADIGAPIVHFSTDYVFDGLKPEPYVESDATGPLNAYGRSKLAGEIAVASANPRHVILRTSWVCSPHGSNFVRTMLRLARERSEVRVVADQQGCPTFATDIAAAVACMLPIMLGASVGERSLGVFHMTSGGETTWYGLANAIFEESRCRGGPSAASVPIATAEYPVKARRPQNSRLSTGLLQEVYGLKLPHWRASLKPCVSALLDNRVQ